MPKDKRGGVTLTDVIGKTLDINSEGKDVILTIDHQGSFQQVRLRPEQAETAATALKNYAKKVK